MRYYSLVIADPDTGQVWQPTSTGALVKSATTNAGAIPTGGVSIDAATGLPTVTIVARAPSLRALSTFTSHPNGLTQPPDPGALNIEFDLPNVTRHTPQGGSLIRLHGVGLAMIGQAANLNGQNFVLSGGMGKGLPLANPAQAGELVHGTIFQAFGNWEGTDQTLDLICNPGGLEPSAGVSFNWQPGQSLASALFVTLTQAFPQYRANINIDANLQVPKGAPQQHHAVSLDSFARYLQAITQPLGEQLTGGDLEYPGVLLAIDGNVINAYDLTAPPAKTVALNFQDFIGQPTWLDAASISFKTVLRGDIDVGDQVKFPAGIIAPYAITSPTAAVPNAPARSKVAFQGSFVIQEIHHFANFRQPDAMSWNSSYRAVIGAPASS